jgi:orotate phosphoribosyltransferase-like protein
MTKAAANTTQLVQAAIRAMKAQGMTEAQIIPELPRLATEAVRFLANKAGTAG